jgi:hypothetical protein
MSAISAATLTRRFLPSQAFVASYFRADAVKIQQNGMNGRTLNAQSQQIGMKNRFGGILCPPYVATGRFLERSRFRSKSIFDRTVLTDLLAATYECWKQLAQ